MTRRHGLLRAASLLLPLLGTGGCIGAVVGTVIDRTQEIVRYPLNEYVFGGAFKYDNRSRAHWPTLEDNQQRDYGNELVGVAVSGGGSRSAYFLACVLDEMRQVEVAAPPGSDAPARSLLDEIDYLSGVSGGSLASAYYALRRPPTSDPAELDACFARYRADMRRNFEVRSLGRLFLAFRWVPLLLTYYHRGHLMAETWDADFFYGATFRDLPSPQPPYPSLMINATSYASGQKFLFTRLPTSRFNDSRTFERLRQRRLITQGYDPARAPLRNLGFDTIDGDIGSFPLSLAVAASAGVPNLLGPVIVRDYTRQEPVYDALGDGSIYDNYGLETLMQLFATILEERPGLRARIIVVDGTGFFAADRSLNYTVAGYADRTVTIAWLRAADYAEPYFGALSASAASEAGGQNHDPPPLDTLRIQVVSLYSDTAPSQPTRRGDRHGPFAPVQLAYDVVGGTIGTSVGTVIDLIQKVNENAKGIGTRFMLSDANALTIEAKARLVVRPTLASDKF